jgi:hypothetical protein
MSTVNPPRFFLHQLMITGPGKERVTLMFADRINVIWGASNTGKSYIVKALDFMSGAKTTPDIPQVKGYDKIWLELQLPLSGRVTLERAIKGGDFSLHMGSINPELIGQSDRRLSSDHSAKGETLSGFLLGELGVSRKQIARTLNGDKNTFTFRHYAAFIYTEETDMIGESGLFNAPEILNGAMVWDA